MPGCAFAFASSLAGCRVPWLSLGLGCWACAARWLLAAGCWLAGWRAVIWARRVFIGPGGSARSRGSIPVTPPSRPQYAHSRLTQADASKQNTRQRASQTPNRTRRAARKRTAFKPRSAIRNVQAASKARTMSHGYRALRAVIILCFNARGLFCVIYMLCKLRKGEARTLL